MININTLKINLKVIYTKIPKDFLQTYLFDILSKILGLLITILLIRTLNMESYAKFTIFNSIAIFLFGVIGSGISLSYIRYTVEQSSRGNNTNGGLYYYILLFGIPFYTIILLFSKKISIFLSLDESLVMLSVIFSFILYINRINQSYFQANELYVKAGLYDNLRNIFISIILMFFYLLFGEFSLNSLLIVYILFTLLAFFLGFINIKRREYTD